eukprot:753779-Hanusia_phi.AAC.6
MIPHDRLLQSLALLRHVVYTCLIPQLLPQTPRSSFSCSSLSWSLLLSALSENSFSFPCSLTTCQTVKLELEGRARFTGCAGNCGTNYRGGNYDLLRRLSTFLAIKKYITEKKRGSKTEQVSADWLDRMLMFHAGVVEPISEFCAKRSGRQSGSNLDTRKALVDPVAIVEEVMMGRGKGRGELGRGENQEDDQGGEGKGEKEEGWYEGGGVRERRSGGKED